MTKTCPRCNESKDIAEFSRDRRRKDGRAGYCKPCAYWYHQDWYHRKTYGISLDDRALWMTMQGGRCASCDDALGNRAVVDHCHESGRVRGLLCQGCNLGLGFMREDPSRMRALIDYVDSWPS